MYIMSFLLYVYLVIVNVLIIEWNNDKIFRLIVCGYDVYNVFVVKFKVF